MAIVRRSGTKRVVMDAEVCAPEDIDEIRHVAKASGRSTGSTPDYDGNCRNLMRAHRLVRQGFLERRQFSEQLRGERRFYWWGFYVTEKGRAFLAAISSPEGKTVDASDEN
jgi:hypothetical protein